MNEEIVRLTKSAYYGFPMSDRKEANDKQRTKLVKIRSTDGSNSHRWAVVKFTN